MIDYLESARAVKLYKNSSIFPRIRIQQEEFYYKKKFTYILRILNIISLLLREMFCLLSQQWVSTVAGLNWNKKLKGKWVFKWVVRIYGCKSKCIKDRTQQTGIWKRKKKVSEYCPQQFHKSYGKILYYI